MTAPQLLTCISLAAGGAEFIPGGHGLGIVAELPYLFYLMGRVSIGVGALLGAEIDAEDDLRAIFALWSGAISKSTLAAAQGGAVAVTFVPFLGAAVSLTISRHVLTECLASAKLYYEHKVKDTAAA